MLRLGSVPYLNALPLLDGLGEDPRVSLVQDVPSALAPRLRAGELDLALVSGSAIGHDIGKALNPVLARGQVEGGVYMGLGEALMEEMTYRRLPKRFSQALVHRHPSMLEYKSPTFHEMPRVHTTLIEEPDGAGPFGAKEAGEGSLAGFLPALTNAVADALGVRIAELPVTPDRLERALGNRRGERARGRR